MIRSLKSEQDCFLSKQIDESEQQGMQLSDILKLMGDRFKLSGLILLFADVGLCSFFASTQLDHDSYRLYFVQDEQEAWLLFQKQHSL